MPGTLIGIVCTVATGTICRVISTLGDANDDHLLKVLPKLLPPQLQLVTIQAAQLPQIGKEPDIRMETLIKVGAGGKINLQLPEQVAIIDETGLVVEIVPGCAETIKVVGYQAQRIAAMRASGELDIVKAKLSAQRTASGLEPIDPTVKGVPDAIAQPLVAVGWEVKNGSVVPPAKIAAVVVAGKIP